MRNTNISKRVGAPRTHWLPPRRDGEIQELEATAAPLPYSPGLPSRPGLSRAVRLARTLASRAGAGSRCCPGGRTATRGAGSHCRYQRRLAAGRIASPRGAGRRGTAADLAWPPSAARGGWADAGNLWSVYTFWLQSPARQNGGAPRARSRDLGPQAPRPRVAHGSPLCAAHRPENAQQARLKTKVGARRGRAWGTRASVPAVWSRGRRRRGGASQAPHKAARPRVRTGPGSPVSPWVISSRRRFEAWIRSSELGAQTSFPWSHRPVAGKKAHQKAGRKRIPWALRPGGGRGR